VSEKSIVAGDALGGGIEVIAEVAGGAGRRVCAGLAVFGARAADA